MDECTKKSFHNVENARVREGGREEGEGGVWIGTAMVHECRYSLYVGWGIQNTCSLNVN